MAGKIKLCVLIHSVFALGRVLDDRKCESTCYASITNLGVYKSSEIKSNCHSLLDTTVVPIVPSATATSTTTITQFNNNGAYNPTIAPLVKLQGPYMTITAENSLPTSFHCGSFQEACQCAGIKSTITTIAPVNASTLAQIPTTISDFTLQAFFLNGTSSYINKTPTPGLNESFASGYLDISKNTTELFALASTRQLRLESLGMLTYVPSDGSVDNFPYHLMFAQESPKDLLNIHSMPQTFHITLERTGGLLSDWKYKLKVEPPFSELVSCNNWLSVATKGWLRNHNSGWDKSGGVVCEPIELLVHPKY